MLIKNQMIEVTWHSQNRKHYEDLGYQFTKYRDKFLVHAEDLSHGATAKVDVMCDYCKNIYQISWYHYISNFENNNDDTCYNCRHTKRYKNDIYIRQENLYQKAIETAKNNGYYLLSKKTDIINNTSEIEYLCTFHGKKKMRINNFIFNRGCPECNFEKRNLRYQLSTRDVNKRIKSFGGTWLNRSEYINNSSKNLRIICSECKKNIIITSLQHYIQHNGQICNECSSYGSKGVVKIKNYLDENNIKYEVEKWYDDCRDVRPLPFDFYLPDYNVLIEFDGEQHYKDGNFNHSSVEYIQYHDKIKTEYCKNNNIKLIRIPCWEEQKIETILNYELYEDIV